MTHEKLYIVAGLCLLLSTFGYGQNIWNNQDQHPAAAGKRFVEPITYRALGADTGLLRSRLFAAPHDDRIDNPLHSNLLHRYIG